jgi:hypothetical protein
LTRNGALSGLLALLSVALTAIALLFVVGTVRYGGSENLIHRVRSEVMAHRPHPDFVPTPLATANGEAVASLAGGNILLATPTTDAATIAQAAAQVELATPTPAYCAVAPSVGRLPWP